MTDVFDAVFYVCVVCWWFADGLCHAVAVDARSMVDGLEKMR